jgi:hypothetical protein
MKTGRFWRGALPPLNIVDSEEVLPRFGQGFGKGGFHPVTRDSKKRDC